jgi:undecaprenol kinase
MRILNPKKLRASFKAAFHGLKLALSEQTFRILCFCGFVVIVFMFIFGLSFLEKMVVLFLITLILTLELINSQIEKILDFLQPNHDPKIEAIKDISAGAVLIASLGATIIGISIFLPHLERVLTLFFETNQF